MKPLLGKVDLELFTKESWIALVRYNSKDG